MRTNQRQPASGGIARRRVVVLIAIFASTGMLLASCGEEKDKHKPGGGYEFPGAKQDEKGQYTQGNPI